MDPELVEALEQDGRPEVLRQDHKEELGLEEVRLHRPREPVKEISTASAASARLMGIVRPIVQSWTRLWLLNVPPAKLHHVVPARVEAREDTREDMAAAEREPPEDMPAQAREAAVHMV